MPVIETGRKPEVLRVRLLTGSAFYTEFELADPDDTFDPLVPPRLVFDLPAPASPIIWTSTIPVDNLKLAIFEATPEQIAALVEASKTRSVYLELDEIVWARGKFEVLND